MKLVHDTEERVRSGLKEAISLLCKTGLNFTSQLSIDGLLGITLDHDEVFLVSIKEVIKNPQDFSVTSSSSKVDDIRDKEITHSRRKAPTSTISRFGSASTGYASRQTGSDSQGTYLRTSPHKRLQPVESTYPGRSKRPRSSEAGTHDPHTSRNVYGCVDLSSDDSQSEYYDAGYSNPLEQTITISPEEGGQHENESTTITRVRPSNISGHERSWESVRIIDSEPEVLHSPRLTRERDELTAPIKVRPIEPQYADNNEDSNNRGKSSTSEIKKEQKEEVCDDLCVVKEEPSSKETHSPDTKEVSPRQPTPNSPNDSVASSSSGLFSMHRRLELDIKTLGFVCSLLRYVGYLI